MYTRFFWFYLKENIRILVLQNIVNRDYVLFAVADSCVIDSQASQPRAASQPCHIYGVISDRIFLGKETMFNLQHSVPSGIVSNLLQLCWELHILEMCR